MIYYLTLRPSEEFAWDYVNKGLAGGGPPAEVLCYEDVLGKAEVPAGVYVFTGLNRFGPGARKALGQLYDQLGADPATRPLNDPNQALGRFELLRRLHQEGMNGFRAFGAWEDLSELRFPVFVRDRSRDGGIPTLLHSIREVEAEVGWALVRGAALSELIIVEFLDTRCEDGLYRKYSAYVVGDEILPVSLEHGRDWVLRYPRAEFTPEGLAEERRFVLEGSHQDQLEKIRLISRIQFGRMDFSVYLSRQCGSLLVRPPWRSTSKLSVGRRTSISRPGLALHGKSWERKSVRRARFGSVCPMRLFGMV
jgi:hypothetical protein